MKRNSKVLLIVIALLLPWMQVQANAQNFNLQVSVLPSRTLISNLVAATSTPTTAGGTTTTSLGSYSVSLVNYSSAYNVAVTMTQLTSGSDTVPFAAMSYLPGSMTWTNGLTSAATSTNRTFASATAVVPIAVTTSDAGTLSMSWIPSLTVVVPGSQATGTYTATITHSLS
jgi:hypothetical protein